MKRRIDGGVGHRGAPFPVPSKGGPRPPVGPWEKQLPLFEPAPLLPMGTPAQERIARLAASLGPNARSLFSYFVACGPLGGTCEAAAIACRLSHQQASPRVHDLARAGLLIDSGKRRATRTGCRAVVYVVRGTKSKKGSE